ncbi:MAG: hypothetical protein WAL20_07440, partial [Rhodomicrobium sp.]
GFDGAGYPATPPVSYQLNRQLAGWNPPPQVFRAFEAHQRQRTSAVPPTHCLLSMEYGRLYLSERK